MRPDEIVQIINTKLIRPSFGKFTILGILSTGRRFRSVLSGAGRTDVWLDLWIGPQGKVYAEIHAKSVIIAGDVIGNILASEMVEIKLSGSVLGNIKCPRISILDGAKFNGSIDTDTGSGTAPKLDLQKADSAKMSHRSSLGKLFSRF